MNERQGLRRWGWRLAVVWLLFLLPLGCKTPPPNLKPPIGPDEYNLPPLAYSSTDWPKQALADPNPKLKDDSVFAKGSGGGAGGGGGGMGQPSFGQGVGGMQSAGGYR